jgi:nucleoside-diphosphate-sugar epimerase
MKVFVTGGTGAIGGFVLPALVEAGHEVTALARGEDKAAWVESRGARAALVSLFDTAALSEAFAGHDAVANLATAIPPTKDSIKASAWETNNRIRTEGSTAVVDAALAAGVDRLIQESISFTYPDGGDVWIDESVAIDPPPGVDAVASAEANANRFTESGRTGIVLRFGLFYGPGSAQTHELVRAARRHVGMVAGRPHAYQSSIHLADAASAVVAALHAPSGIYNVVDDEPLTKRDYAGAVCAVFGTKPWVDLPGRFARLGGRKSEVLTRSHRVSNAKFKHATGWSPAYPSAREGFRAMEAIDA